MQMPMRNFVATAITALLLGVAPRLSAQWLNIGTYPLATASAPFGITAGPDGA
jgi:hypothetical protein